jgi:hypothetical protein
MPRRRSWVSCADGKLNVPRGRFGEKIRAFQRQSQEVGHPFGRDGLGRLVFVERRGAAAEDLAGLAL